jgi:hypothetical protein
MRPTIPSGQGGETAGPNERDDHLGRKGRLINKKKRRERKLKHESTNLGLGTTRRSDRGY